MDTEETIIKLVLSDGVETKVQLLKDENTIMRWRKDKRVRFVYFEFSIVS